LSIKRFIESELDEDIAKDALCFSVVKDDLLVRKHLHKLSLEEGST
jgi:hypothetical protein